MSVERGTLLSAERMLKDHLSLPHLEHPILSQSTPASTINNFFPSSFPSWQSLQLLPWSSLAFMLLLLLRTFYSPRERVLTLVTCD